MSCDPLEATIPDQWTDHDSSTQVDEDFIDQVEASQLWTNWRDNLALTIYIWIFLARTLLVLVKKTDKRRRCWSSLEEQQLIVALKEVVTRGWKCENGFKIGYLGVLEQLMLQALPGTDLKAEPHINSKIHVWRKNYASLSTMVSRSGFDWNDSTHTIEVDNDQIWENYVKTDSNARTMRYKPWPFYKDWCEIFGKDRATGEHAEAFADVVHDLLHKSQDSPYASNDNEYDPFTYLNEESEAAPDDMSIHGEGTGSSAKVTSKGKSKKRKVVDSIDDRFIDLMTTFCEKTDSRLGELAKRIGFEHDASMSRKKVFEVLGTMNQLSDEQQIYVAKYLCNNTKDLDLFFLFQMKNKLLWLE
ncbi:hypothetical protein C2S52_001806 [Perilla frutescens var. hirtella]|nr:hypothetical protein C2S52_001806 [Perilla frutescens var. hirtella]